jgi:hypothetical protein
MGVDLITLRELDPIIETDAHCEFTCRQLRTAESKLGGPLSKKFMVQKAEQPNILPMIQWRCRYIFHCYKTELKYREYRSDRREKEGENI